VFVAINATLLESRLSSLDRSPCGSGSYPGVEVVVVLRRADWSHQRLRTDCAGCLEAFGRTLSKATGPLILAHLTQYIVEATRDD
jgi:hypothetical protein